MAGLVRGSEASQCDLFISSESLALGLCVVVFVLNPRHLVRAWPANVLDWEYRLPVGRLHLMRSSWVVENYVIGAGSLD